MAVPDFALLPPEINSGRMYSGPGSGPLLGAAAAWDAVAGELFSAATGYATTASALAGVWLGPAAISMAASAARYIEWLHRTATVAEQTALQAHAAAAAYELAFTMTVPPPVIAANRSLLLMLVATNFFGQNTPAIAATETHYAEMWLQDAIAMSGYAAAADAACRLTPFTSPPQTAHAGAGQPSALPQPALPQPFLPQPALHQPVLPQPVLPQPVLTTAAADPLSASTLLITGLSATKVVNTVMSTTSSAVSGRGILIVNERLTFGGVSAEEEGAAGLAPSTTPGAPITTPVSPVSAVTGRARLVGQLSIPAGWATAAPEIQPTGSALPSAAAAQPPTALPPGPESVFSQSVLGTLSRDGPDRQRCRNKPVIVRSPAAG